MSRETDFPEPPDTYTEFVGRFPKLGKAWSSIAEGGRSGPLDARTRRLIKLAVAVGAMREGAVHANVRKALSLGITEEELHQVVALSASTLGLPSTVACYTWVRDVVGD